MFLQVRFCIRQVLEGVDYLHHLNVIHLDVKVNHYLCRNNPLKDTKSDVMVLFCSLTTSSWPTFIAIRSGSATSETHSRSLRTRRSTVNTALLSLWLRKSWTRRRFLKPLTSGKDFRRLGFSGFGFILDVEAHLIFLFPGRLESSRISGEEAFSAFVYDSCNCFSK